MTKKHTSLYYDVTQLVHWGGKITGIPRVMNELAVRFHGDDPTVRFVSWVKEIQEFCEIDLERTLAQRGHGIVYVNMGAEPAGLSTPESGETVSGQEPAPATEPAAAKARKQAIRVIKGGLRRGKRISPALVGRVESRLQRAHLQSHKVITFGAGDSIFIPWGEWWDPNFIAKLETIHAEGGRIIQILHDMSPIVVPQFSNSGNAVETYPIYCRRILPICSLVLSNSNNSKRDAIEWLKAQKLPRPLIEVFRLGDDIHIAEPSPATDPNYVSSGLKGQDFILSVGTIELKKNHMLMYYVYKLAKARGIDLPKLVIVGRLGWMTEPTYELMTKDPEVADKFVFLLNTSDEELSWLYDKCLFTVLASFYEGWGIPIAESVARGVPCLCSNTSSMVEVAEGFVEHFTPTSTDECLAAIQRMLQPKVLAEQRKRVAKYHRFSWDESYQQVKNYMERLA